MLWDARNRYGTLQDALRRSGVLRDAWGHSGMLGMFLDARKRNGTLSGTLWALWAMLWAAQIHKICIQQQPFS